MATQKAIKAEIANKLEFKRKQEQIIASLHGPKVLQGFRNATMIVQAQAKRNAPVNTGRLRSSIGAKVAMDAKNRIQGIVGTNVTYAPYMELGTGTFVGRPPHFPPPAALNVWAARHGIANGFIVARSIYQKGGLEPRKFMENAVKEKRGAVERAIEAGYKKALE